MLQENLQRLKEKAPLVNCITNPVTMNDCANLLLACGASPIMAQDENETGEIVARVDAVVLNLGVPDPARLRASELAAGAAGARGIPVVLDPVGVGASPYRLEAALRLMEEGNITLIRGNLSEIRALAGGGEGERGVDSREALELPQRTALARRLSGQTGVAVLLTGETDVAAWGRRTLAIRGGDPWMGRITGCGCMLSALCGAFLGAGAEPLWAAASAAGMMSLCGSQAAAQARRLGLGTGSMRAFLIDRAGLITPEELERKGIYEDQT